MNCITEVIGQDGERHVHRCRVCGKTMRTKHADSAMVKMRCGLLIGDRLAELTKAIGIPPCGGCEKRLEWLNQAHAWLLGRRENPPGSA